MVLQHADAHLAVGHAALARRAAARCFVKVLALCRLSFAGVRREMIRVYACHDLGTQVGVVPSEPEVVTLPAVFFASASSASATATQLPRMDREHSAHFEEDALGKRRPHSAYPPSPASRALSRTGTLGETRLGLAL